MVGTAWARERLQAEWIIFPDRTQLLLFCRRRGAEGQSTSTYAHPTTCSAAHGEPLRGTVACSAGASHAPYLIILHQHLLNTTARS